MYIGSIMPWSQFNDPDGTGITYGRLIALGFMILFLRRIPAIMLTYKLMPGVVKNYKEALFMGYFGPIGAGAVFYLEHSLHLFPELGEGDEEETNLIRAITPVVYWLVLFSIVVHGLSIPGLNIVYNVMGVKPIKEDAVEVKRRSIYAPAPSNAVVGGSDTFVAYNRFSRPTFEISRPIGQGFPNNTERSEGFKFPRYYKEEVGQEKAKWQPPGPVSFSQESYELSSRV